LVYYTIATYKSCATTALVLSTGKEETLAEKKGRGSRDEVRGTRLEEEIRKENQIDINWKTKVVSYGDRTEKTCITRG
jgi:hypothetical protein